MTALLPDAPWRHRPGLDALLDAIGANEGMSQFIGGAVRDTLLGLPVHDVDIATMLPPRDVMARLNAAAIKVVPTGIDHGTVTAIVAGAPVEITTLRRDVSTDGRRATIAYTDDWRKDAARRDFTINALYADPVDSTITDYFDGVADLEARVVRFIGSARDRIAEDHLRILRYFRFFARYGQGAPDAEAYAACRASANSLMALSRERIADELLKLLIVDAPASAVRLMIEADILRAILPEIDLRGVDRLEAIVHREAGAGIPRNAVRRLTALLPQDAAIADQIAARLKLSNKARKRIAMALAPAPGVSLEEVAYRIGLESAIDHVLLNARSDVACLQPFQNWQKPTLSVSGGALIARGLQPGPDVAKALHLVQDQWIAEGFPGAERTAQIADQIVSKFQRARQ